VDSAKLVLALIDEAYQNKTWHGPNLWQSLKGVSARQAAWRPGRGRHNIWEVVLHAAYSEVCGTAKNRRREAWLFPAEGEQLFPQARKRQVA
jgi:hypothetical protein